MGADIPTPINDVAAKERFVTTFTDDREQLLLAAEKIESRAIMGDDGAIRLRNAISEYLRVCGDTQT